MNEGIEVSFCQTCGNRRKYASLAVPFNLEIAARWAGAEFVILDYGSNDGLDEFVRGLPHQNMIRYFRYELDGEFQSSHAKNLSHCASRGRVLCNLDIDNLLHRDSFNELTHVKDDVIIHGYSGRKIIRYFGDVAREAPDGSFGRIAMSRSTFFGLRGYDESFNRMGYQDEDLIKRAKFRGIRISKSGIPSECIDNEKDQGWTDMFLSNMKIGSDTSRIVNTSGFGIGVVTDLSGAKHHLGIF